MAKGDNLVFEHSFGSAFRQHSDNRTLKCHECGEPKSNDELESDGYKYVCHDCLEGDSP